MSITMRTENIFSFFFAGLMFIIGILNIMLIHPVPGIIYLVLALIFLPSTNDFLRDRLNFTIPFFVKVILFLLIMWVTLGVGDLMEYFEARYL